MSNFNFIAPVYDRLVRLVFGKKLWTAQKTHLHLIQPTNEVLILGGGTGRMIEWLPECKITYLEKSSEMMELARRKGNAKFIHADFLSWETDLKYDWVICPFFLDCFEPTELRKCLLKISDLSEPNGHLIVTDFQATKTSHQLLALMMIWFFRLTANLKARKLYELKSEIENYFQIAENTRFLNGLVFSDLYSFLKK